MANTGEAEAAARAGADLVGVVGPMPSGPGVLDPDACAVIAKAAPAWVTPVLLTASETAEAIADDVLKAGVRAVQIVRPVDPEVHRALNGLLPGVRRIQVIHVEDASALGQIPVYAGRVDAFLLDSGSPLNDRLGGTGQTHDWSVSAEFVRRTAAPVFLAGGLTPDNAARAMIQVRPFGLDICSGVRMDNRLDPEKLAALMAAVSSTTRRMGLEPMGRA